VWPLRWAWSERWAWPRGHVKTNPNLGHVTVNRSPNPNVGVEMWAWPK